MHLGDPAREVRQARSVVEPVAGYRRLYRTVDPLEAFDIFTSGRLRPALGQEGKYFFVSLEHARELGPKFESIGLGAAYRVVSATIAEEDLALAVPISNAGEGPGYFVPEDLLDSMTNLMWHDER